MRGPTEGQRCMSDWSCWSSELNASKLSLAELRASSGCSAKRASLVALRDTRLLRSEQLDHTPWGVVAEEAPMVAGRLVCE
jgi:hypothetical protein